MVQWCPGAYIRLWKKWNKRPKHKSANPNLSPKNILKPGEYNPYNIFIIVIFH